MLIGLDFDNTIVGYDTLFHRLALERGLIGPEVPETKLAVRDHLRRSGREAAWTEMQGDVYGNRMEEAASYPGVVDFFHRMRSSDHRLVIVSHRTRRPFAGPAYDLHAAARSWIDSRLGAPGAGATAPDAVYFELTQASKIARIAALGCDVFLDDLPEIFAAEHFPAATRAFLFDPDARHGAAPGGVERVGSWREFGDMVEHHAWN